MVKQQGQPPASDDDHDDHDDASSFTFSNHPENNDGSSSSSSSSSSNLQAVSANHDGGPIITSSLVVENRVAALEEQVRVEELVLKHLLERKKILSEEVETTRLRYQRLLERRVLLQERRLHLRAARIKHLTLQRELQESLIKSRERLARLTKLEQLDDDFSCEFSANSEEAQQQQQQQQQHSEAKEQPLFMANNSKISFDEGMMVMTDQNDPECEDVLVDDRPTILLATTSTSQIPSHDILVDFNQRHVRPKSLMTFLPSIGPNLVGNIVRLAMREANALDDSSSSGNHQSWRRSLLWNTCLDFGLLSPVSMEEKNRPGESSSAASTVVENLEAIRPTISQESSLLDPNVLLCPYELAGVCADEFCPYQHSTKQTLSREQIPLPPLSLRPKQDSTPAEGAVDTHTFNGKRPAIPPHDIMVETKVPMQQQDSMTDMDFIALPTSSAGSGDDDMAMESSESENDGDDDDDDYDALLGRSDPTASSTFTFWWGGQIESSDVSLDQMIRKMQAVTTQVSNIITPVQSLACAVEVSRLAIHGGRFDLADCCFPTVESSGDQAEWCQILAEMLQEIPHVSFLYQSVSVSFIRSAFESQAILAVVSAFLSSAASDHHPVIESSSIVVVLECCSSMASTDDGSTDDDPAIEFTISDFRNILSGSNGDWSDTGSLEGGAHAKVLDLQKSLSWVKQVFGPSSPHRKSLHRVDNHILQPCWTAVRRWISLLRPEEVVWGGLKATVIMGYMILGCLEWFAAQVHHDTLDASLTASLITIDATVSQILKGLAKHFSHIPMLDVMLSPLFAANVATATFLRLYPISHHRLESLLALNPNNHRTDDRPVMSQFSELLWSQFFHLRMALPVDSGQESSTAPDEKKEQTTTRSKGYSWEPSKEIEEENQSLLDRIEHMGIRLHHITQEGDRILAHAMSNSNLPASSQLDASRAESLRRVACSVLEWIFHNADQQQGAAGKQTKENLHSIKVKGVPCFEPNIIDRSSPRPASPEIISSFPRSLLLAGHALQNLSLSECDLTLLPASFGLYFPNLLSLDLSGNRIKRIPLSFRSMLCLERLLLSHNHITGLLGDELMASLKCLDVSHNCLSLSLLTPPSPPPQQQQHHDIFLQFAESLGRRCFQLEELNLSWNELDGAGTTKLLEEVIVPKWTIQMKRLMDVQWMPQTTKKDEKDEA